MTYIIIYNFKKEVVFTTGGNSLGAECHFPFVYENKTHNSCIDKQIIESDDTISYSKFCSTTKNFDKFEF